MMSYIEQRRLGCTDKQMEDAANEFLAEASARNAKRYALVRQKPGKYTLTRADGRVFEIERVYKVGQWTKSYWLIRCDHTTKLDHASSLRLAVWQLTEAVSGPGWKRVKEV